MNNLESKHDNTASDKIKNTDNNPYFAARKEWDDRYGDYIAAAHTWKITAFYSMGIAAISVVCSIWLASQAEVTPFIVEIDKLGIAHAYQVAEKSRLGDERFIKAQLISFITDWRSISSDNILQRHRINNVYKYILANSPANRVIDENYKKNNPLDKNKEMNVTVQVDNPLQTSPTSYQMDWQEIIRDARTGEVAFTEEYKAIIECELGKQSTNIKEIMANPSGVYIKNISWSKKNL